MDLKTGPIKGSSKGDRVILSRLFRKSEFGKIILLSSVHIHQYLYKTTYEKQKGHYIGCRTAKEDPKLVWAAKVLKMQNDRLYKKAYNDNKAKISIPADMVSISAAKEGQALASDVDYRHYLHHWSCFPDQNDVIQARKAYDLQSDVSCCLCTEYQLRFLRNELFPREKTFQSFAWSFLLGPRKTQLSLHEHLFNILPSLLIAFLTAGLIQKVFFLSFF